MGDMIVAITYNYMIYNIPLVDMNFVTKNSEPLVVAVVKKSVFSAFGQVM